MGSKEDIKNIYINEVLVFKVYSLNIIGKKFKMNSIDLRNLKNKRYIPLIKFC